METWKWVALAVVVALAAAWGLSVRGPEVEVTPVPPVAELRDPFVATDVTFSHGDITLAGTLTLPHGEGPHPALVLVSGSGPQDRDSAIPDVAPGYRPFKWIAEHLSARGIAVLRCDDRGVGESTGSFAAATTADFADDAEAALTYLLSRPDIDPGRVGLLGHSEGAMVVAMVAARNKDVAFAVSMAGVSVDGYETIIRQVELITLAGGLDAEQAAEAGREQRAVLDLVRGRDWEALEAHLAEINREQIAALPSEQQEALGDPEQMVQALVAQQMATFQSDWYQFFLEYDPGEDWAQVTVPVLAIFAELDVQVDPEQNTEAFERAMAQAGNDDFTVVVLSGANHLFQPAETGGPWEYPTLPQEFVPMFLPTLTGWLLERVDMAGGG